MMKCEIKRYISAFLMPCILLYIGGCSSYSQITMNEFTDEYTLKNSRASLKILTIDSTLYKIEHNSYILTGDTLLAKGQATDRNGVPREFDGKILMNNISMIEKSSANYFLIPVIIIGFAAAVWVLLYLGWVLSGKPDLIM